MKPKKLAPQTTLAELCIAHKLIAHPHAKGLASCTAKEFEPSSYKGINYNTRKIRKHGNARIAAVMGQPTSK